MFDHELPEQSAERGLFLNQRMLELVVAHPDWSFEDIADVAQSDWVHRAAPDVREFVFTLENESELFDREEAGQINAERAREGK